VRAYAAMDDDYTVIHTIRPSCWGTVDEFSYQLPSMAGGAVGRFPIPGAEPAWMQVARWTCR
jgi:hypothetical protein